MSLVEYIGWGFSICAVLLFLTIALFRGPC